MAITGRPDTTEADYFDVIEGKTAVLFSAAAAAGIEITGAGAAHVEALRVYGMKLGMAFQIMDDALDYTASAAEMGKNAGDDFADQKITLPAIIAWQDGDAEERAFWQRMLGDAAFADGDLTAAQALLAKHDAVARSIAVAGGFVEEAASALTPFMDGRLLLRRWQPRLPTPPASPPRAAARYRTSPYRVRRSAATSAARRPVCDAQRLSSASAAALSQSPASTAAPAS